jgi:hypothetical protein
MSKRAIYRGLPLAGGAAAGVVFGHILTYLIAFPASVQRAQVLAQSGHAYWPDAMTFMVQAAAAVGTIVAYRTLRERAAASPGDRHVLPLFGWLTLQLSARQIAGFAALEVIERLIAHAPLGQLQTHHLIPIAVAVQVVVAGVIAGILLLLSRTVAHLAGVATRGLPRPADLWSRSAPRAGSLLVAPLAGGAGLRGPPPHLLATI